MKRLRLLVLIPILAFLLLSSCSAGNEIKLDPNEPVVIVVWHYYHGAQKTAFDDAVKAFNETLGYEKGVIVEAVSHGGVDELSENVIAAAKEELDADDMPNIFGSYGDTALIIMNMGLTAKIDDYLTADEIALFNDDFINEGRLGTDSLYVLPIAKSTESLMLNKTDFDSFAAAVNAEGLSVSYEDLATWEGLLRVSDIYYNYTQKQSEDGKGKAFFGIDSPANYLISCSVQCGQELANVTNGQPNFSLDRDIMQKLWSTYYEPMVTGRFLKLGRFCSDDIKTGDTLCFTGSTSSASYFPSELLLGDGSVKSIELKVLPMPVFENGIKAAMSQGAGMVIAKSEKKKEYASALFLKWFTETERNVKFALGSSYLPVTKQALDENLLNSVFESIDSDDIGTQNTVKALKVGLDQLRGYTLYASDVFDRSAEFRQMLPELMVIAAREDSALYAELLENGQSGEQALEYIKKLGKFDDWYEGLVEFAENK